MSSPVRREVTERRTTTKEHPRRKREKLETTILKTETAANRVVLVSRLSRSCTCRAVCERDVANE